MRFLSMHKPQGTKSFRLAHSAVFDYGGNAGNTDKDVLDIYCAPPGMSIVYVDQSGAEALIVAYLAQAGKYRELFTDKLKPHIYVALHLFMEKFRRGHPAERYYLRRPRELKALPEWADLAAEIEFNSKFEYDIGKRTGHACCDADTEVLTPDGWQYIHTKPKVIAAQSLYPWQTTFEEVLWHEYSFNGEMYRMGPLAGLVTPTHRVPHFMNGLIMVQEAEHVAERLDIVDLPAQIYPQSQRGPITREHYFGSVYCPTTTTGYFLCRRAGYKDTAYISGNSNYKMGPNTFREATLKESEGTLNLSLAQARTFLEIYRKLFPEIVAWQEEIRERIERDRILYNLLGFPRRFEQIITDGYVRDAISWIPQSTVGCITHTAYKMLTDKIRAERLAWRPFNNKHDSYAALVPTSEALDAARVMIGFMAQRFTGWDGSEFTMKSDAQIGQNMAKHSDKNPLGLKKVTLT